MSTDADPKEIFRYGTSIVNTLSRKESDSYELSIPSNQCYSISLAPFIAGSSD